MHTVVKGPSAQATMLYPRGIHLLKRAGVRAENFENDLYKVI